MRQWNELWWLTNGEIPWWAPERRVVSWQQSEELWATAAPSSHSSAQVRLCLHREGLPTATLQNYIQGDLSQHSAKLRSESEQISRQIVQIADTTEMAESVSQPILAETENKAIQNVLASFS